ncbi:MAG: DUF3293 domain-containing protein [Betaproteobacteria bacterium]|nr:DUF3293 domain-containing protein [Betaproteobacteria bacterium]
MPLPPGLREAYEKADYVVFAYNADAPQIVFHVGEPNAALDELLDAQDVSTAAFVSPGNRHGRREGARANAESFLRMNSLLASTRYRRYAAEGRDPKGEWPAEAAVLVCGIPREEAEGLGRALEQNAIVFLERGRAPELVVLV